MSGEIVVHSELGASAYSRWKECPGSIALCRDLPKRTSIYAEEGTLAHEIASLRLLGKEGPDCDPEMNEAICVYTKHIHFLRSLNPSFQSVEQKLDLSEYHPKLFGTADYVCYFPKSKNLYVVDYKHGAGVAVEVKENEQLMYYGLGALHANKFPVKEITLTIVQPRCFHKDGPIRSWTTTPIIMLDYAATLIEDAEKTEKKDAPLKVGDHCRWCNAAGICPALHHKAITSAQEVFSSVQSYDPQKLSDTLRKLDQIESWAKNVRSFAYNEAEAGRIPPGFKLVDKRPSRKWDIGISVHDVHEKCPSVPKVDLIENKLKSPAQVEKMVSKDEKIALEGLIIKESSGKNLVDDSDDRPGVLSKTKEVFEIVEPS